MKPISKKLNLIFVLVLMMFLTVNFCQAAFLKDETKQKIENQSQVAGMFGYNVDMGSEGALALVQTLINAFLSIIGVLLLVYLLTAGYKWMTAHGEEEKVTEAKDTIKRAIVGVIIIVAAYAISVFVMFRLQQGILNSGNGSPAPNPPEQQPANPQGNQG